MNLFAADFWRIFRYASLNFLAMHKALLRKFALPNEKSASKIYSLKVHAQV